MANKAIAVLGAGHMGQSAFRILLRHRPDQASGYSTVADVPSRTHLLLTRNACARMLRPWTHSSP